MSFTLLSNLGGWSFNKDGELVNAIKEETSFNDETPRISFFEFAKKVEIWYGKEMFKSVIEGLIGSVAFNFEYPVTLVGGLADEYFKDMKNVHSTSAFARYIVNTYTENESLLAGVYVKINPLCVLYCWWVFINFEYFNLISNRWSNPSIKDFKYNPVPLFQITNEHMLKGCLNSVFSTVKIILNKAERHFCDKCSESNQSKCKYGKTEKKKDDLTREDVGSSFETCNPTIQEFLNGGFCINKTMYAVRVITSHLNYLDQYKTFIWNKLNDNPELSYAMQTIILNQMEKYLGLWGNRRVVENMTLLKKYHNNVKKAKEQLEEMKCEPIVVEELMAK